MSFLHTIWDIIVGGAVTDAVVANVPGKTLTDEEIKAFNESNSASLALSKTFLGKEVEVTIDRPLGSVHPRHGFEYEANYGFIAGVKAPDGEDLDAYVLGVSEPLEKFTGRCIAIVHRENDDDDKLIVVSAGTDINDEQILKAVNFQEQFFTSVIIR